MSKTPSPLLLLTALLIFSSGALAQNVFDKFDDSHRLIDEMVTEHDFKRRDLEKLFRQVEYQPSIIETITRPAEGKPWYEYRPIFLTEQRIKGGVKFWAENEALLARAEKEYGVPAHIIVAIVGVETLYGRHKGRHKVIEALSTLGFGYPERSTFFRGQIKEFLLMAREERRDPLEFLGSYAGAMGMPQFIPSSFRHYAVDFDGDGRRDLWDNTADIIGSVANYFHQHKWRHGEPVTSRATLNGTAAEPFASRGVKPGVPLAELQRAGVETQQPLVEQEANLLVLQSAEEEQEYWVTLHNFYVITRYNRSPLYAMAVNQLSEAIRTSRAAELRKTARKTE
ncbi:MAG: lytic murein transglycosylase B [Chromatiales bacterium]|nr:lytic murein transglycosylase B [Chromatiales bacterium]